MGGEESKAVVAPRPLQGKVFFGKVAEQKKLTSATVR
jgi:hypothetical protein